MDVSTNPKHNQLIAALPRDQWQRWRPHMEHVKFRLGHVLYEAGDTLSHVYFRLQPSSRCCMSCAMANPPK